MKYKTTRKEIKERGKKVISVSFCRLQNLLRFEEPFAYSTRVEGWACDYYNLGGLIVSTGYSPTGDKVDHEILKEYDQKANNILCNHNLQYEEQKEQINQLIEELVNKIVNKK